MTDNDLRQPPALIEPDDSDDEGPRKRLRMDEGSTPDHRIAILQAALLLVVAAELHTDQNLNSSEVLSHRISNHRGHDYTTFHHVTSSISKLTEPRIEPDSTLSRPTAPFTSSQHHSKKIPRHHTELSQMDTNSHVLKAIATGAVTNTVVARNDSSLPSGRPLLAPPRLPHLKCGERITTRPTSRQTLHK